MRKLSLGLVALGANLASTAGSASETLQAATNILHDGQDITITAVSRFWLTPADPPGAGPDYVNAAATISTLLSASQLLERLHRIEADFGRDRSGGRWSARVLDLDLIAFDDMILPDMATLRNWINLPREAQLREAPNQLILPHPRMQDRGFVLAPTAEIAPGWRHPLTGRSVIEMLAALGPDGTTGMHPLPTHSSAGFP
ncbi:2-amino-4-hydroxy-6-hydroxymethyldihydropteridine diphosphokinase [Paracoccus caeni]|uniref:2-amino-4-hydroxy-6-hydroxymethyldihydropteridine pyrophosphokinase n=1 Tax=Paracoccus caeni TaxID=657651 RepID=A0A934VZ91_9RHOB|nr:2-amino-4-hydroxy-6-hydroxymethyldihydropteridine diphosphokinase [Paracoccus caeni]MBK4214589.1 2-amino-4-hydroxy-6-hydroxymethyldihydropteridine diphosphokinase [Paracoccus caeni]